MLDVALPMVVWSDDFYYCATTATTRAALSLIFLIVSRMSFIRPCFIIKLLSFYHSTTTLLLPPPIPNVWMTIWSSHSSCHSTRRIIIKGTLQFHLSFGNWGIEKFMSSSSSCSSSCSIISISTISRHRRWVVDSFPSFSLFNGENAERTRRGWTIIVLFSSLLVLNSIRY